MIPKTLHQFWGSNNGFKEIYWPYRLSWMRHNPDWSFMQWTLESIITRYGRIIPRVCLEVLQSDTVHWILKTDVSRWIPVFYDGGVYADHDVECLKSMKKFLTDESFAGTSYVPNNVGNAVFGAEPGNKIILEIMIEIATKILSNIEDANNNVPEYGVNLAGKYLGKLQIIYPLHYFYPIKWDVVGQSKIISGAQDARKAYLESFCIHWWSGVLKDGWIWETIHKDHTHEQAFGKG